MESLRVMSLFSGIGAFEKALTNQNIHHQLVGFSEVEPYAIRSYCAIHNISELLNVGDITKVNKKNLPDFDLLVGGSPCQSFSLSGKRLGFEDTKGTLFFDYAETLKEKQPSYFIYENVRGMLNHDNGKTLQTVLSVLSELGYLVDFMLLNSKYFNVAQHRERIYIIGVLKGKEEAWRISTIKNAFWITKQELSHLNEIRMFNFPWPKEEKVRIRLKDVIEKKAEESYYIDDKKTEYFRNHYMKEKLENKDLKLWGYLNGKFGQGYFVYDIEGISSTARTTTRGGAGDLYLIPPHFSGDSKWRIRKLMPIENWRLQGFQDEDFHRAKQVGVLHSHLYRQAGNSITVSVLEAIFQQFLFT